MIKMYFSDGRVKERHWPYDLKSRKKPYRPYKIVVDKEKFFPKYAHKMPMLEAAVSQFGEGVVYE
jgi:hypothetical protein